MDKENILLSKRKRTRIEKYFTRAAIKEIDDSRIVYKSFDFGVNNAESGKSYIYLDAILGVHKIGGEREEYKFKNIFIDYTYLDCNTGEIKIDKKLLTSKFTNVIKRGIRDRSGKKN